jgi:hypothetical protein
MDGLGGIYTLESCRFFKREWLKSPWLPVTLMEEKYNLHIINKIVSMIGPLRDLVYIYEYKKIIILNIKAHTIV